MKADPDRDERDASGIPTTTIQQCRRRAIHPGHPGCPWGARYSVVQACFVRASSFVLFFSVLGKLTKKIVKKNTYVVPS